MARVRGTTREIDAAARHLRNVPTLAEERLWQALRRNQCGGLKFRRQHALGSFILDFCCADERLVVEVDGNAHDTADQRERDAVRTEYLNGFGYRVLRFRNEQVLSDMPGIINAILDDVRAHRPFNTRTP